MRHRTNSHSSHGVEEVARTRILRVRGSPARTVRTRARAPGFVLNSHTSHDIGGRVWKIFYI